MPLLAPSHPSLTHARNFSSTARVLAKSTKQRLEFEHSAVPPYPYGPSQVYKQSNFGLYGIQKIRFGNIVSEKNEIKTRRHWRPNVQFKRLWSEALQNYIRLRITTRVLRTVDKVGGLDEYLLGEKAGRLKELGMGGWKLRWRLMQTDSVKERYRLQRERFGLPPKEEVLVGSDGEMATPEEVEQQVRQIDAALLDGQEVEVGEDLEGAIEDGFMHEETVQPAEQGKVLLLTQSEVESDHPIKDDPTGDANNIVYLLAFEDHLILKRVGNKTFGISTSGVQLLSHENGPVTKLHPDIFINQPLSSDAQSEQYFGLAAGWLKFHALAGLAEEFANRIGWHYTAGLWREDFRRGLL